ncbi:lysylphosphatidylglycerol synthase transmembrane domain-containing protein [Streptomyces sp. NPDC003860]
MISEPLSESEPVSGAAAEAAGVTAPKGRMASSGLRRLPLRQLMCLVPFALLAYWAVENWSVVSSGVGLLKDAHSGWLVLGGIVTGLWSVASAFVRQGTVVERLPAGRLVATQFAAGSANQLLPAGIGAHLVTLRFLRGCGVPLDRSTAALGLYSLVKGVARAGLLLSLVLVFPEALELPTLVPPGQAVLVGALVLSLVTAAVTVLLLVARRLRKALVRFLRTALLDARTLHRMPARTAALWGGALAFPLLQSGVLICVAAAVGLGVPWPHLVIAYLTASIAAGLVPTPGGIGSVEPALAFALVMVGAPLVVATATVIGFRFLTVWLPLLPGVAVLALLVRRRVL